MTETSQPAEMRNRIVEHLIGATGDPEHVVKAARALATRAEPDIAARLGQAFEAEIAVEVADITVSRVVDARPAAGSHAAMSVATGASSPDALLMTMEPDTIAIALCAIFGGDPTQKPAPIDRPLSSIEFDIAARMFAVAAEVINGSGERSFNLHFPLPSPFVGEDIEKHVLRDGPAATIVFEIAFGEARGPLKVTIPQRVLLQHRGDATTAPAQAGVWRERFNEEVMRSKVSLSAAIPLGRLTLGQIAGFTEGQIVEFPENAQANARLSARDQILFICELGKLGQNYTVRIVQPFDAHEDFVEGLMPA